MADVLDTGDIELDLTATKENGVEEFKLKEETTVNEVKERHVEQVRVVTSTQVETVRVQQNGIGTEVEQAATELITSNIEATKTAAVRVVEDVAEKLSETPEVTAAARIVENVVESAQQRFEREEEEFVIPTKMAVQQEDDNDFDFDIPQATKPVSIQIGPSTEQKRPTTVSVEKVEIPIDIPSVTIEAATPEPKAIAPSVVDKESEEFVFEIKQAVTSQVIVGATDGAVHIPESTEVKSSEQCEETKPVIQNTAAVAAATEEWEAVKTITPDIREGTSPQKGVTTESVALVSYKEAIDYCRNANMMKYKAQTKTSLQRRGFAAIKHALLGPPKLNRNLNEDRDLIFCIAACPFDNEESIHCRMIQTVYRKLTGSKFDCPRFGPHWDQIGFQGNDPSTDLRGCGLLGLVNILYLITSPDTLELYRDIFKLSRNETQNFPFCVMAINITRITLQTMREDCLNKECNKQRDVIETFHEFYVALYLYVYQIWRHQNKTISDSGFVIKEVEKAARKNTRNVLKALQTYKEQKKLKEKTGGVEVEDEPLKFTSMDDMKEN